MTSRFWREIARHFRNELMIFDVKGPFCDPSILILRHSSVDIDKISLFPNFKSILMLCLLVMYTQDEKFFRVSNIYFFEKIHYFKTNLFSPISNIIPLISFSQLCNIKSIRFWFENSEEKHMHVFSSKRHAISHREMRWRYFN